MVRVTAEETEVDNEQNESFNAEEHESADPDLVDGLRQVQQRIKLLNKRDQSLKDVIPGYSEQLSLFDKLKQKKIVLAAQFRDIQMQNIEQVYQADVHQAESDFDNDINTYNEKLLAQALEEEKRIVNQMKGIETTSSRTAESAQTTEADDRKPRKLRNRRGGASSASSANGEKWSNVINMSYETYSKKKRIPCSVEGMNFSLGSDEIVQDLKKIKNA